MSNKNISELYPEEIRGARLGSCYNAYQRKLKTTEAFDIGKLKEKQLIKQNASSAHSTFTASTSSSASMKNDFFALNTEASAGVSMCKAVVGFNMAKAHAKTENQKHFSAQLMHEHRGATMELKNCRQDTLFECMTKDFRVCYNNIMTATPEKRWQAIQEFIDLFGHGVITNLQLRSGAYATLKVISEKGAMSQMNRYGTAVGVSYKAVEIKGAANWANELKNSSIKGKVEASVDVFPSTSPSKAWAYAVQKEALKLSLDQQKQESNFASLAPVKTPDLPTLPKATPGKAEKKAAKVDSKEHKEELVKSQKQDQKKNIEADGKNPVKLTPEEYKNKVVQFVEGPDGTDKVVLVELNKIDKAAKEEDLRLNIDETEEDAPMVRSSNGSELGDFFPHDFTITPWTDLFPDLSLEIPVTWSSVNLAKLNMFVYSRLQFGQYLEFLTDVGSDIHGHTKISLGCTKFSKHLDDFIKKDVKNAIKKETFTEKDLEKVIKKFKAGIISNDNKWAILGLYNTFFKHYDFFRKAPFGFFLKISFSQVPDSLCYHLPSYHNTMHPSENWVQPYGTKKTIPELLEFALRLYPVITHKEELLLVSFNEKWRTHVTALMYEYDYGKHMCISTNSLSKNKPNPFCWKSISKFLSVAQEEIDNNTHFFSIDLTVFQQTREASVELADYFEAKSRKAKFQPVSYDDFDYDEKGLKILGQPMFADYPFNEVSKLAKPFGK